MKVIAVAALAAVVCTANPLAGVFTGTPEVKGAVTVSAGPRPGSVLLRFAPSDENSSVTFKVLAAGRDWTRHGAVLFTFRSDSTIRWFLALSNRKQETTTFRVMPYENVRATAAIPVSYLTREFMNNRAFLAHWLSNWANHIDISSVEQVTVSMAPNRAVTLELGPLVLSTDIQRDSAEIPSPLVDELGQWIPGQWPGKVSSEAELMKNWAADKASLERSDPWPWSKYGGVKGGTRSATGFFRVENVDGRWWLIDPEGHRFFSTGMDCVRTIDKSPLKGREKLFAKLPGNAGDTVDFYEANLTRRHGGNFFPGFRATAEARLRSWGFNTVANWSDDRFAENPRMPYVTNVRIGRSAQSWQGYPDAFSDAFVRSAQEDARRQCAKFTRDPYLIGYFIGNEPRWHGRNLVERILADPAPTATKQAVQKVLAGKGDSAATREYLLEMLSRQYFKVVSDAIRKADPNHLVLGIRWAGTAPDAVLRANDVFDVFSINIYRWEPDPQLIEKIHAITKKPVMIGEFHFGAAERGYAPSLVMVKDQRERGAAYRYYVERAAALAPVIGTHYFQYVDQPVTGRFDGENYNLGFVNQQDLPYEELVRAARATHARIYEIHAGKLPPVSEMAKVR